MTLIHHYLLGRVLRGPLLLPPVCVGRVVVHVDHSDGNQREHCVRDDQVISQMHLYKLVLQVYWDVVSEVFHQYLSHVGQADVRHKYDEDQHGQASCRRWNSVADKRGGHI